MPKYENPSDLSARIDALSKNIREIRKRQDIISAKVDAIVKLHSRTPENERLVHSMCDEVVELEAQEAYLEEELEQLLLGGRGALH